MTTTSVIDLLKQHAYDHAVLTTFDFNPEFFEHYCLDALKSLRTNGHIMVLMDARCHDALLADPARAPRQANLRYLLHPIAVSGCFHAKVHLYASPERALLLVGSGNLTSPGMSTNAEVVTAITAVPGEDEDGLPIIQAAFTYLRRLVQAHPSDAAMHGLDDLAEACPFLVPSPESPGADTLLFVHNLDEPILAQIQAIVRRRDLAPDQVHAVSRYLDATPTPVVGAIQAAWPDAVCTIHTQQRQTNMTTVWVERARDSGDNLRLRTCTYHDGEHDRPLHAKLFIVADGREAVVYSGSANCTSPGLLRIATAGNSECGLVWCGNLTARALGNLCEPFGAGADLIDPEQLVRCPGDDREDAPDISCDFRIGDATFIDASNTIRIQVLSDEPQPVVIVRCGDGAPSEHQPHHHCQHWVIGVDEAHRERMEQAAVVIQVRSGTRSSNRVLLHNLQDLRTGTNMRTLRLVLDAQKSSRLFTAALADVLASGEEAELLRFLNTCSIEICREVRSLGLLRYFAGAQPAPAFGASTPNRIRYITEVYPAAMAFIERHLRRLKRHLEQPTAEGAANFLHIAIAILQVARSQLETLTQALEHPPSPDYRLDGSEWGEMRRKMDAYLRSVRTVCKLVGQDFVPAFTSPTERRLILAAIAPDRTELQGFDAFVAQFQPRVFACSIFPEPNPRRPPFSSNVGQDFIRADQWPAFLSQVRRHLQQVLAAS